MAQFALLAVPMSLLLVGDISYCLNVLIDSALRFEAIAVARFGALADVSLGEASDRAGQVCASAHDMLSANCSVNFVNSQFSVATFEYQPLNLLLFRPERVIINAMVPLEIAK
ncbi:MAG: hypothetical protein RIR29_505 [Actinomycetota bacterium]